MLYFRDLKKNISVPQLYYLILVVILFLAIGLRLLGLNKGLWLDEYYSLRWLNRGNFWDTTIALRNYNKPPLYFLLLYSWSQINNSEAFLRLLSVFFDLVTILITIKWLKQYSNLSSLLAGLYLATVPLFLRYAQEIRPYSLLFFAVALTCFYLSQIVENPQKLSGYYGIALSLSVAIATHLIAILLVAPLALITIISLNKQQLQNYWQRLSLSFCLPIAIFSFFYFFYLQGLAKNARGWWMPSFSTDLFFSTVRYVFSLPHLVGFAFDNNLNVWAFLLLLSSLIVVSKYKTKVSWLWGIVAILFWLQVIIYSVTKVPIFWYRIVLLGLIPFIAFVTLQISAIRHRQTRFVYSFGFIICCLFFTFSWTSKQAYQPVEEYREVASIVNNRWRSGDLIFIYPDFIAGTLNYYLDSSVKESQIVIRNGNNFDNINNIAIALEKRINQRSDLQNIFIIVRSLNFNDYQKLLALLQTKIERPFILNLLTIVNHDRYFVRELRIQQELFLENQDFPTEPLYTQNNELFFFTRWQVKH